MVLSVGLLRSAGTGFKSAALEHRSKETGRSALSISRTVTSEYSGMTQYGPVPFKINLYFAIVLSRSVAVFGFYFGLSKKTISPSLNFFLTRIFCQSTSFTWVEPIEIDHRRQQTCDGGGLVLAYEAPVFSVYRQCPLR